MILKKFDSNEEKILATESDLLSDHLTTLEKQQLESVDIDNIPKEHPLKEKVDKLLKKGLKLGLELEKLSQKGIKIEFLDKFEIKNFILDKFDIKPKFLFIKGNENLLNYENINMVYSYVEFKSIKGSAIFFSDRPINKLLSYKSIVDALNKKDLLIISDKYKSASSIKKNLNTENQYDFKTKDFTLDKGFKDLSGKKVFISGSRSQNKIPDIVKDSLKKITKQNIKILIGDSEKGVDSEIIDFLQNISKYKNVTVYTIKDSPRVDIDPKWEICKIPADGSLNPKQMQMEKDRVMADLADWGLAVFKPIIKNRYRQIQISSGTLRNTIQMLVNKKGVKFFYLFENKMKMVYLKSIDELKNVIFQYKDEKLSEEDIKEILTSKGVNPADNPSIVKFEKINKKFEELLKIEITKYEGKGKDLYYKNTSSPVQLSMF